MHPHPDIGAASRGTDDDRGQTLRTSVQHRGAHGQGQAGQRSPSALHKTHPMSATDYIAAGLLRVLIAVVILLAVGVMIVTTVGAWWNGRKKTPRDSL
jgi:hypothetical protein